MDGQKIGYERVALAANAIKKSGKDPSLTDVCNHLKVLTITPELSQHLRSWYHTQPQFKRSKENFLSDNIQINTQSIIEKNVEMEKSLSLLRATLESTADGIMMVNGKGQIVDWNQKFVEMWRIPSHLMEQGPENLSFDYILSQLNNPAAVIADVEYLYKNPEWEGELPELHFKDGRIFERYTRYQRIGEEIVGRVYSFRDITEKRLADDQLRIRERAIEASSHGVVIINLEVENNPIIYTNRAFSRISGYYEDEIIGKNIINVLAIEADQVNQKRIELVLREGREETIEVKSFKRNSSSYWCELSMAPVKDGISKVKHYVCIVNDISQRREMESQLIKQATHDALTQLPNRVLLADRVEQAILQAKKNNKILAFLFLDLDKFKLINDSLGHGIGDKLLQNVANQLLLATGDFDTVARLGGDEFVILLNHLDSQDQAYKISQTILASLEKPFYVANHNLRITGSLGLSFYPKDGLNYEILLKNADLSMYYAKDKGRNNYQVFDQEMNNRIINHMQLETALQTALKNNEFFLVYQPLVSLKKMTVVGFEALIRWKNPLLGLISPFDFISLAEENGLIVDIGQWVLEQSCHQIKRWHQQGYKNLSIAVNLSGRQFYQTSLPQIVKKILTKTKINPKFLELELTESLLIEDIENAVDMMNNLKSMGMKLVIDDFGTGYSSLSYLKQFPVNKLKIDRSFISELTNKENDAAIVKAIINLGHSLNLEVLAEGIETPAQRDFLIANRCDFAQGYYFKPPTKAPELNNYLKNNT